jgi:hypothetical protein
MIPRKDHVEWMVGFHGWNGWVRIGADWCGLLLLIAVTHWLL